MTIGEFILDKLLELGEIPITVFFPEKYPHARWIRTITRSREKWVPPRRSVSVILSRLRSQGLVERRGPPRYARWAITKAGRDHLKNVQSETRIARRRPDGIQRLVIFDIPEEEKTKRDTLRRRLVVIGYRQLQKSVWIGEFPLPDEFIKLIDELELGTRVHIFSIREQGTMAS